MRSETGHITAFKVDIVLRFWKGYYHKDRRPLVHFIVGESKRRERELLDMAIVAIAVGITRNVFGTTSIKGFLRRIGNKNAFQARLSAHDVPVFLARASRGNALRNDPLTLKAANIIFQAELRAAGLHTGDTHANTLYAFRRTFATIIAHQLDRMTARYFLGHGPNSKVLEKHYDRDLPAANTSAALLGEEGEERVHRVSPMKQR